MTLFDPTTGRYVTFDPRPYGGAASPTRHRRPGLVAAGAGAPAERAPASEGDCGEKPARALPPGADASQDRRP